MAPSVLTIYYNLEVRKTLIADKFWKRWISNALKLLFNICMAISLGAVIDGIYIVMITAFSICEVLILCLSSWHTIVEMPEDRSLKKRGGSFFL